MLTKASNCQFLLTAMLMVCSLTASEMVQSQEKFGEGIATRFPGDQGIVADPRVILFEDFESANPESLEERWESVHNRRVMSFSDEVPTGSPGRQSLLMTHVGGAGDGGGLYQRLPEGQDRLFARFYVKIDEDCAPIHHFGTCIGGNHPSTAWPSVRAGQPPDGKKSFWVGIEPFGRSWRWDYYAYWNEMRGSPPRGQTWGNSFIQDAALNVERGRWVCIETMVQMNDVNDSDGELALWIDGRLVSHLGKGFPKGKWQFDKFYPGEGGDSVIWNQARGDREFSSVPSGGVPFEGIRWRTAPELQVNFVWTYLYMTSVPEGHVSRVWYDHIVAAKEYIGPLTAAP